MRNESSRHNRYLGVIGGLAFLAVLLVGLGYGVTEAERADIETDAEQLAGLHDRGVELTDAIRDQEAAAHDYLLSGQGTSLARYETAIAVEAEAAVALLDGVSELPEVRETVEEVRAFAADWRARFAGPAIAAVQAGGGPALEPFIDAAADDHEAIDESLDPLAERLRAASDALRQRGNDLAAARTLAMGGGLAGLLAAAAVALWLIRRYGRALELDAMQAGVLNRFTEVTSFASDDTAIAASNLEALALLGHPDAAVTHVLNRSKDRAVPEAISGGAIAEVLPLSGLSQCPGLVRGSMVVVGDASAPLSVHCPVYPADQGTVVCVPLISSETVGAVHLYWGRADALPLELRASIARIAEHAALAIGNRRMLAALRGQADTDPRTGLANSRAFDRAVEEALATRGSDEPVSVLMIDLDHFKDFNDRFGHPAGDEALRVFAGVLQSCMRDEDLAARYGGEEFSVLLPGVDGVLGRAIAERVRARTEATVISLAPGGTARITASIGVASAPDEGHDRLTLLHAADEALYHAKNDGRNRVASASAASPDDAPAERTAIGRPA